MDLNSIEDINQLKALAYDQMLELERTQNNLRLVNSRIATLQSAGPHPDVTENDPGAEHPTPPQPDNLPEEETS